MTAPAFLFAGGGTGGHIYPALAIREQLAELVGAPLRSVFLCSQRLIDRTILEREEAEFLTLPAAPPALPPRALARFVTGWGPSVRQTRAVARRLRAEGHERVVMLATGGFVSAPAAQAARVERVPVFLVNLDDPPGRAARFIARHAARVFSTAPDPPPGVVAVPPIIRAASLAPDTPSQCRRRLGLDPDRHTLLVLGGSQGARTINHFLTRFAGKHASDLSQWQILHQTGADAEDHPTTAYEQAPVRARVQAFLDPVGLAWGAATLAIARAGAGTVAEAWGNRVPTLFMPYPFHRDAHQRRNAARLADQGAALILDDHRDPDANLLAHGPTIAALLADPGRLEPMREALCALDPPDGARRVAAALLDPTSRRSPAQVLPDRAASDTVDGG